MAGSEMAKLDSVNEIKCFICSTHLNNKNQEAKILYAKQVRKGTGRDIFSDFFFGRDIFFRRIIRYGC